MQRTEAISVGSYIDASPQIAKGAGAATKRINGVICLAAKNIDEPFLNRALGVGTIADATPRLLDRIERFYESIGKPPRIAIATGFVPLAQMRLLERRGYAPVDGGSALIYVYKRQTPPAMPRVDGLTIERVGPDLASVYSKTGFESFSERGPQFVQIIDALVRSRRRGLRAFLGRIDGEPAATGMLFDVRPIGRAGQWQRAAGLSRARPSEGAHGAPDPRWLGTGLSHLLRRNGESGLSAQHGEPGVVEAL